MKRVLLICLVCIPVAFWTLYKPTRVLAPELAGVPCASDVICLDDMSRYEEAVELYSEAYEFVNSSVGAIEKKPRAIFCTSETCFQSFGINKRAAGTVGVSGIVISPRGWKDYYMRHEFIHHLQSERLGVLRQLLAPAWFTEGMAYSFSEDPRPDLAETFRQYRAEFEEWYRAVGEQRLWVEARKLYR